MKRRKYSKEFKLEALKLFDQHSNTRANLARELGVERSLLYKWRRELKDLGEADAFVGLGGNRGQEISCELTELKKRVARLEEENAILKKAEAYFTKKPL